MSRWSGATALRRAATGPLVAIVVAAASLTGNASAKTFDATLHHADVEPAKLVVVTGDSVVWHNASLRDHTVTSSAGGFDSGIISPGRVFSHLFEANGGFSYACRIHPSVQGEVHVYPVVLTKGTPSVEGNSLVTLEGRAVPNSGTVTIEKDSGSGYLAVGAAVPAGDGSFRSQVKVENVATYRAAVPAGASPGITLKPPARDLLRVSLSRRHRGTTIHVKAIGAPPGASVVLQAYLRERFGWWPLRHARLGRSGEVGFRLHRTRARRFRALLVLPDGVTVAKKSRVLRLPRAAT